MSFLRRTVSTLAVASLLAAGAVGTVAYTGSPSTLPAAVAQGVVPPALAGIPDRANLHVHKIIGLETGILSNGLEADKSELGGEPAVGITYTAYRINQQNGGSLDLATEEGWLEAQGIELDEFFDTSENPLLNFDTLRPGTENPRLGQSEEAITDNEGTAAFSDLDTGLYLIMEENNPYSGGAGGVAVAPSAPFLVTVPLTDPSERESWLETVHVYPKGQQFSLPTKKILDPTTGDVVDLTGTSIGDRIGYEVSTLIPAITTGSLPGFSVTDKLPAELGGGAVAGVRIDDQDLALGTHYKVRSWRVGADDRQVIIARLTPDGLALLDGGQKTVTVIFTALLNAVPTEGLNNTAWFRRVEPTVVAPDGWDPEAGAGTPENPHPGTATNTVASTYGEIVITKVGENNEGAVVNLAGAQFELRRCHSEGPDAGKVVDGSLPIQVGDRTTSWTTRDEDSEGTTPSTVTISGIHLSNTQPDEGGTAVTTSIWADEGTTEYCLVETQAPEGYELLPAPHRLGKQLTGTETQFQRVEVEIENVRSNAGFNLPLTGGMGIWLVLGGGVLLLLLAAAYYLATRNRQDA